MRASRSFPFVSKVAHFNLVEKAVEGFLKNTQLEKPIDIGENLDYLGVKASQFSFSRLDGADPLLSVDMSSTGEVGCLGRTKEEALLKALLSVKMHRPEKGILISSGYNSTKDYFVEPLKKWAKLGLPIYATAGSQKHLEQNGIQATQVYWPDETKSPNAMDILANQEVDMVINIPKNRTLQELGNDYLIRRAAVDYNIPLFTNLFLSIAFLNAINAVSNEDLKIDSLTDYYPKK